MAFLSCLHLIADLVGKRFLPAQHCKCGCSDVRGVHTRFRQLLRLHAPKAFSCDSAKEALPNQVLGLGEPGKATGRRQAENWGACDSRYKYLCPVLNVSIGQSHGPELKVAIHETIQAQELRGGKRGSGEVVYGELILGGLHACC